MTACDRLRETTPRPATSARTRAPDPDRQLSAASEAGLWRLAADATMDHMGVPEAAQTPFGTDVTMIEESLQLTPSERWERHARAVALVEAIQAAARAKRLHEDTGAPPR